MPATFVAALWLWAIWACAEYWRGNPNYSYGWLVPALVLAFVLRRVHLSAPNAGDFVRAEVSPYFIAAMVPAALAGVFFLELARTQVWHFVFVIWAIAALPVALTLWVIRRYGGPFLFRACLFPILFFLTAVPWPPRIETPITAALIKIVAAITTEILHWLGIEAATAGGAISLRTGVVGITEACSGIRSLQSGIMFGLAMGEWFLLRPLRRLALLFLAVALALVTNLARTLILSLEAERHGIDAVEKLHDFTGSVVVTLLVLGIWFGGWLLRDRAPHSVNFSLARLRSAIDARPLRVFAGVMLGAGIIGLIGARILSASMDARDRAQTSPLFSVAHSASVERVALPRDVLNELHPTSGEFFRTTSDPPGIADCFHFFWKPSPWNRFVLVHRPDVCMPGIGWEQTDRAEPLDLVFGSGPIRFYAFRFRRGAAQALEIWGVWRNGEAVPIDYRAEQVLTDGTEPAAMHLQGKRRSATEIVACSLISDDGTAPKIEKAVAILKSVFQYESTR